jgi:DNA polymerase elongation subunit (family B)
MRFYTNAYVNNQYAYLRGYDNGKRFEVRRKYQPYMFVTSQIPTGYTSLDGKYLSKLQFSNMKEARDFVDRYEEVANFPLFGSTQFTYQMLYEDFPGEVNYDVDQISVVSFDIETSTEGGFPNLALADKEVITISIRRQGKTIVLGMRDYIVKRPATKYHKCSSEADLLSKFLYIWNSEEWKPDVITGWNIENFDVPYLYTRITNVLGEKEAKRLSPWGIVNQRQINKEVNSPVVYDLIGIATLDYLALYKKFSYTPQESYKLDHIAEYELGEKKLDYSEYDSMHDFYVQDFQKFVDYNIHDVVLVDKLEEKLKFIEQVFAIAYDAKVNYVDTFTTVRIWDVIIANYLMDRKVAVPHIKAVEYADRAEVDQRKGSIVGGYVKDPAVGLHNWVVSFDLNSLYPHLIMQYNISPETFRGMINDVDIEMLLDRRLGDDIRDYLADNNLTMAANGAKFDKDFNGFLPTLMDTMYNDRSAWKKKMLAAKQQLEEIDAEIAKRK